MAIIEAIASRGGMSFFTTGCSVCGRRMRVSTELLGEAVQCQHCSAVSLAVSSDQVSRSEGWPLPAEAPVLPTRLHAKRWPWLGT